MRKTFREHAALLALSVTYVVGAAVFMNVTGQWTSWLMRLSYLPFAVIFIVGSGFRLLLSRESRRFESIAGAAIVFAVTPPLQSTFNSVKQAIGRTYGFPWDARLADADRWLHFGRHPWEWLAPMFHIPGLIRVLDIGYMLWFPVILGFLLWVAWTCNRDLRRRALLATLILWVLCGNIAAAAFSSAGPCYFDYVVNGSSPYAGLMTLLDSYHQRDFLFARNNQIALWTALQSVRWLPFGGISAMPSVHVAMAVLLALIAQGRSRTMGVLLTLFAVMTMIGSVVLAWHYAIDGYVGAFMAYAIWRLVR